MILISSGTLSSAWRIRLRSLARRVSKKWVSSSVESQNTLRIIEYNSCRTCGGPESNPQVNRLPITWSTRALLSWTSRSVPRLQDLRFYKPSCSYTLMGLLKVRLLLCETFQGREPVNDGFDFSYLCCQHGMNKLSISMIKTILMDNRKPPICLMMVSTSFLSKSLFEVCPFWVARRYHEASQRREYLRTKASYDLRHLDNNPLRTF